MNIFRAIWGLVKLWFWTEEQGKKEREQMGPEGRAYDKWLDKHGYEAQYQAYFKKHGTHDGFVYKDQDYPVQ